MEAHQQLEKEWAEFNDLDPAGMVACSSGTAALHLALEAFRLPQGSEVIVPDFTMIACARAVTLAGLMPMFVDCDERLLMDFPLLYAGWDRNTARVRGIKAVMAVHVYGRKADMNCIAEFCSSKMQGGDGLRIVEDLAEAHGIRPHPATDAAAWSFYSNKIVAGEEGGAVWFRDPEHAALARQLRSLGFTEAHDFDHVPRGHNYRMSNLHAHHIVSDLRNQNGLPWIEGNQRIRQEIESWYDAACPVEWRMPPRDVVWVYDVRIPGADRDDLKRIVSALNSEGIAARLSFLPMHAQREYTGCRRVWDGGHDHAFWASEQVFYLPVQPGKTTETDCKLAFDMIRGEV